MLSVSLWITVSVGRKTPVVRGGGTGRKTPVVRGGGTGRKTPVVRGGGTGRKNRTENHAVPLRRHARIYFSSLTLKALSEPMYQGCVSGCTGDAFGGLCQTSAGPSVQQANQCGVDIFRYDCYSDSRYQLYQQAFAVLVIPQNLKNPTATECKKKKKT